MVSKIKQSVEEADKKLDERIRRRKEIRLERSMELSPSSELDISLEANSDGKGTKTS